MTKNHINQTAENRQKQPSSKKANIAKTAAAAALITIAGAVHGQSGGTAEPKYHNTPGTAYIIPNLPNGSEFYLKIKKGKSMYITIDGADANTGIFYKGTAPAKTVNGNIIKTEANDCGNRLVNYTENGVTRAIGLTINYEGVIGVGNVDNDDEVHFINDETEETKLNAGTNMGYYKRRDINDATYTGDYSDSIRTVTGSGQKVLRTNDGTGYRSNDTINIELGSKATQSTIERSKTTNGAIYKYYKFDSSKVIGNDSTQAWVEEPSLSFVGNGAAHSVASGVGIWRESVKRKPSAKEVMDTKSKTVDIGTTVVEVAKEEGSLRQRDRELSRETEVPSIIYNIHGQEMSHGFGKTLRIPDNAAAGAYITKYTENGKTYSKIIIIK